MKTVAGLTFWRRRPQSAQLTVAHIDPVHFAALTFGIKGIAVVRIEHDVEPIATGQSGPIRVADSFLAWHRAWPDPILIVLQPAGDAEGRLRIVQGDAIKFSCRNSVEMIPAFAGRERFINAAIGSEQNTLANWRLRRLVFVLGLGRFRRGHGSRLNDHGVTIGMDFLGKIFAESFAAVVGNEQREPQTIHALIVRRINPDLAEVKWTRINRADPRPFLSAIFRTKYTAAAAAQLVDIARAAFETLDDCHDDLRIAG